jgi:hypothetical protein
MKEAQQLNGSKDWGIQPRQQDRYYSKYCQSVALQSGMRGGGLILEKLYEVIKK